MLDISLMPDAVLIADEIDERCLVVNVVNVGGTSTTIDGLSLVELRLSNAAGFEDRRDERGRSQSGGSHRS